MVSRKIIPYIVSGLILLSGCFYSQNKGIEGISTPAQVTSEQLEQKIQNPDAKTADYTSRLISNWNCISEKK